jgi:hypothetical protein
MPSRGSNSSRWPSAFRTAEVSAIGAGSATPVLCCVTTGPVISVCVRTASLLGAYSATVPFTSTSAPTTAVAGGAESVKTNRPSDVRSSASGLRDWMKNPLDLRPVTTPEVVTGSPTKGDVRPDPWIS